MEQEHLKKVAEYVAMQCYGCSDSPMILAFKAYEVMKKAIEEKENPYKALNDFLGTDVSEVTLKNLYKIMWKIPKQITTPNIEDDIKHLLSTEILQLFKLCEDIEKKMRLHRIVEMLDFADHLLNFREYLLNVNKPTIRISKGIAYRDDRIQFNGHDYSGCEFDIEAFVYYTYVSVIDTSMAKSATYVSPKIFFEKSIHEVDITKEKVLTLVLLLLKNARIKTEWFNYTDRISITTDYGK